ncbi:unnamed protein product [Rhizopus microsporus]
MSNQLSDDKLFEIFSRLRSDEKQPLKLEKPTVEDIKKELEETFLTPQRTFPASWLSKCQEHWEEMPDYTNNVYSQLAKPRTTIHVARQGFDGDIIGYRELSLTIPTSLQSTPRASRDFLVQRKTLSVALQRNSLLRLVVLKQRLLKKRMKVMLRLM